VEGEGPRGTSSPGSGSSCEADRHKPVADAVRGPCRDLELSSTSPCRPMTEGTGKCGQSRQSINAGAATEPGIHAGPRAQDYRESLPMGMPSSARRKSTAWEVIRCDVRHHLPIRARDGCQNGTRRRAPISPCYQPISLRQTVGQMRGTPRRPARVFFATSGVDMKRREAGEKDDRQLEVARKARSGMRGRSGGRRYPGGGAAGHAFCQQRAIGNRPGPSARQDL